MENKMIGIVKIGTIPQVVNVVINQLVCLLQKMNHKHITGIQTTGEKLVFLPLNDGEKGNRLPSISLANWKCHQANLAEKCDILIVFYNEEETINIDGLRINSTCKILMVPINLFNEQNPNIYHLGFDSALNEVVNNIYKVEDTAGSLLFPNKRLFLIKIPGKKAGVFLKFTAAALQCELIEEETESELQRITQNLEEKYHEGKSYALLLVNETVEEEKVKKHISAGRNLDFRTVMIEEAQCIGGKPTASDRIFAFELAEKMAQWTLSGKSMEKVQLERKNEIKFVK
ncbi:6-phosphofructokinase [Neobacillus bataviensis]|uniref:6-phosphofructokinase n=1 Tax=Neobacillus bataviensis TaxID=220685 RepID=UPI001CBAB91B|nr:6-phosphofructokinase [Neobacillus bataviensis]